MDTYAKLAAQYYRLRYEEYPADWEKYGKQAGIVRNLEMVKDADYVVAFWDGTSRGTKSTIDFALKHRKNLEVIFPEAT